MAQNEPHSVKIRRQALHQTHHYYYLNISVEAANLSYWRIESNQKNRFGSENRIESKLFRPNWNALITTTPLRQLDNLTPSLLMTTGASIRAECERL